MALRSHRYPSSSQPHYFHPHYFRPRYFSPYQHRSIRYPADYNKKDDFRPYDARYDVYRASHKVHNTERPRLILREDAGQPQSQPHEKEKEKETIVDSEVSTYEDFIGVFLEQSDYHLDEFLEHMKTVGIDEKCTNKIKRLIFCSALRLKKDNVISYLINSEYHHAFDRRDGKYCVTLSRCDISSNDIQNILLKFSPTLEKNGILLEFK